MKRNSVDATVCKVCKKNNVPADVQPENADHDPLASHVIVAAVPV